MRKGRAETKVKDLEQHIEFLKKEKNDAAVILTATLRELEYAEKETLKRKEEIAKEEAKLNSKIENLKSEETRIHQERERFKIDTDVYNSNIRELKQEQKDATKRLGKINDQVMSAEDDVQDLGVKLDELNVLLKEREELSNSVLPLKNEVESLKEKRGKIQLENDEIIRRAKISLSKMKLESEDAVKKKEEADKGTEKANEDTRVLSIRIEKVRRDMDIIIDRLEKKYKETYPNLRLNISI